MFFEGEFSIEKIQYIACDPDADIELVNDLASFCASNSFFRDIVQECDDRWSVGFSRVYKTTNLENKLTNK